MMFRLVREASRDIVLCTVDSSTTKAKIGRDPKTCTVKLGTKAVAVSREHADLTWTSNGVTLVDNSSFGTFVDGVKIIKSSKLLKGGERLKIGQEEFILEKIEEVKKVAQSSELSLIKPAAKNSIASYFTKKDNVLPDESQPDDVSIRKILTTDTPSDTQKSHKVASQVQSKPIRGGKKRVNPLLDFDDDGEDHLSNIVKGKVLAVETPSDSITSPKETSSVAPVTTQPAIVPVTPVTQANTTTAKKKKVSLFAKPSQRVRTQKPMALEDDDIVELKTSDPLSNGGPTSPMDDGFVRPSIPRNRTRATPTQGLAGPSSRIGTMNRRDDESMNYSDDMMGMNASSIATQIVPPVRKPMVLTEKNAGGMVSGPPRKKVKSLFADYERQQKMKQNNKPKEKSLLDEDDNGVLNIRYDYVEPKEVIGERAYSCIENVRIMDQAAKEAKARLDKKYAQNDSESQYATAEELTSILCSSYTEDQRKGREEAEEKDEDEVERVGDETLDEEIKSQMVKFCDTLVVSQPLNDSMASVNPSQAKGFKKFKKAKQGRFASQSAVFSSIIGGSDLVDFRQIHM